MKAKTTRVWRRGLDSSCFVQEFVTGSANEVDIMIGRVSPGRGASPGQQLEYGGCCAVSWVILILVALLIMRFARCGGMMAGGCGRGMLDCGDPMNRGKYGQKMAHHNHGPGPSADLSDRADGASEVAEFRVVGMVSPHCAETVSTALRKVSGVDDVVVNLKSGIAIVIYDASKTDRAALKAAVSGAGYELVDLLPEPSVGHGYGGHSGHGGHCC